MFYIETTLSGKKSKIKNKKIKKRIIFISSNKDEEIKADVILHMILLSYLSSSSS